MLNLVYYNRVRGLSPDDRRELDDALLSRPGEVDPETGLAPPSWWRGEEDAGDAAETFLRTVRRG
jgi:hypothetical protein